MITSSQKDKFKAKRQRLKKRVLSKKKRQGESNSSDCSSIRSADSSCSSMESSSNESGSELSKEEDDSD